MSRALRAFIEKLDQQIGEGLSDLLATEITLTSGELDRIGEQSLDRFGNEFVALLTATVSKPHEGTIYIAFDLPRVIVLGALLEMVPPPGIAERLTEPVFDADNADAFEEVGNILIGKLDEVIRECLGSATIHTKKSDSLHGPPGEVLPTILESGEYYCLDATINIAGQDAGPIAFFLYSSLIEEGFEADPEVVRSRAVTPAEGTSTDAPADPAEAGTADHDSQLAAAEPGSASAAAVGDVGRPADEGSLTDDATAAQLLSKAMGEAGDGAATGLTAPLPPQRGTGLAADIESRGSGGKTVLLVVDDDITTRAMIRSYLEGPDISIFEAVSWREAGLFLRRHRVDGILLDLYLSDLNGIDACRKLHLHPSTRGVPVLLCTSRPSREAVIKGLKAGAADFLIKPFSRDRLIEKLDTLLHPV
ncbi:MAG: response regulator [Nitrospirota bacterium]|jgi:CheY-like chemotaxis protein